VRLLGHCWCDGCSGGRKAFGEVVEMEMGTDVASVTCKAEMARGDDWLERRHAEDA
jgi:hypothetical protein